jgi:hypothetical protein
MVGKFCQTNHPLSKYYEQLQPKDPHIQRV